MQAVVEHFLVCQDALSGACAGMEGTDSFELWRERHVIANSQK